MRNVIVTECRVAIDILAGIGYTRRQLDTPNYSSSNHFIKKRQDPLITGKRVLFFLLKIP